MGQSSGWLISSSTRTPAIFAASMMVVPFGTLTGAPSMITLTNSSGIKLLLPCSSSQSRKHGSNRGHGGLARALDVRLELVPKLLDPAHNRRGAGVAQHADRLAGHVIRQIQQELEMLLLALPCQNALQDPHRPRGPFAALGTLGT